MVTLKITDEQVIELVKQLPPESKQAVLNALGSEGELWWQITLAQGEERVGWVEAQPKPNNQATGSWVLLRSTQPTTDPIALGLKAIASGYSLRFPEDLEKLEHQFEGYDALYARCRLDAVKTK